MTILNLWASACERQWPTHFERIIMILMMIVLIIVIIVIIIILIPRHHNYLNCPVFDCCAPGLRF